MEINFSEHEILNHLVSFTEIWLTTITCISISHGFVVFFTTGTTDVNEMHE